jgi:pentatricopeptide repeat protein
MRRTRPNLTTKALSPYAQALKHVAIRGAAALGPSAKEQELAMYRAGNLPADYRPPVQGKWDDTIERWAYAWQFPATEVSEDTTVQDVMKSSDLPLLTAFCQKLLSSPPSKLPGSSTTPGSAYPAVQEEGGRISALEGSDAAAAVDSPDAATRHSFYDQLEAALLAGEEPAVTTVDGVSDQSGLRRESDAALTSTSGDMRSVGEPTVDYSHMQTASTYSASTGVPAAYLDDGSEVSAASKELAHIFETSFSMSYEEPGIAVAISALSHLGRYREAKSLFDFAKDVGLGPTTEMYRSLMRYFTSRADVNSSMALIEEMKDAGITPRIGNWHELMKCLHRAKDYPAVQQVVDHMKAYANIEPNEATFALQLKALSKDQTQLSTLPEAVQLFDQMENVYGFIASRPHYHALMASLCQSPNPDNRQRCEALGKKMEMMGMVWDQQTYLYQIQSAQVVGDVAAVEKLFAKMRNEGVSMTVVHLAWAIHGHVQALHRLDYAGMKERSEDPLPQMLELISTSYSIYQLVIDRGWKVERVLVNALLVLACQSTILAMEHCPTDVQAMGRLETQARTIWESTFEEVGVSRDVFSFHAYIALLAHQQRIDEAEKLFQEMCITNDFTPMRRTYEALIFMHLSSGEEGGAARALHYLEAMERAKIAIRPSLIKKIVRVNDESGYKRDMKRRARRIMQAREEYMARKEEGFDMTPKAYEPPQRDAEGNLVAVPLPIDASSPLAWWDRWKRETISKHELFDTEAADGTPRGLSFDEKNAALTQMGIESKFLTPTDVPKPAANKLLPKLRSSEGEVAGALWGLDGGDLSYPKDGNGPHGWGVRLWRERQLITKEFDKIQSGGSAGSAVPFSTPGNALRNVPDQLAIERTGAATTGELRDVVEFSSHVYDDGTAKPASEFAVDAPRSSELVWQQERKDRVSPYKTDDELSLQADSTFHSAMEDDRNARINSTVRAIQNRTENEDVVVGRGVTRKSKHDYLEKWREMYSHGTLEVADEPLERYGVRPDDHKQTLSRTVREWNETRRRVPASEELLERLRKDDERAREGSAARRHLKHKSKMRKRRQ